MLVDLVPSAQVGQIPKVNPEGLASRVTIEDGNIFGYFGDVGVFGLLLLLNIVVRPSEFLLKLIFLVGIVVGTLIIGNVVFGVRRRIIWKPIGVVVICILIKPTPVPVQLENEAAVFDGEARAVGQFGVDFESLGLGWVFRRH
jgi:hypothetical protein